LELIIIAAISLNRVIGNNGRVPWDIPEDLHRFMRLTKGHTVVMGRKSFESLGKPLRERRNVVLTSSTLPGTKTYASIDSALAALKDQPKVFIIGGGQVFAQTIEQVDTMQLTIVEKNVDGDTFFPPYEDLVRNKFRVAFEEHHEGFRYIDYRRSIR
jgi:dihydrofolate reductase